MSTSDLLSFLEAIAFGMFLFGFSVLVWLAVQLRKKGRRR